VQDDPEEMVVESRPEDTNRSKSEKEDDTDDDEDEDDDRTSAVRKDVGRDERVGKEERSENDRKRDKSDDRDDNDDDDDDDDEGVRMQTRFEVLAASGTKKESEKVPPVTIDLLGTLRAKFEYQPGEGDARFQVRNARFGVAGEI